MDFQKLIGRQFGQYKLQELIGSSEMSAMYRGYQANLKREVAIKVLAPELTQDPEYLERFNHEISTAARLEHAHIVPIYDYGVERGISYVVMRLLTGRSLKARIQHRIDAKQPLPSPSEVAGLLDQITGALDYAHSQGVIHRDVKPSNIMFDDKDSASLVDFGIGRLLAATSIKSGNLLGTPAYMSPEQWRSEVPTPAADQYALGVTIYELLTGQLPFEGNTLYTLMAKHARDMPTPVHVRRTDVPEAVTRVIERALAKKAQDRFSSCTAFAQAFEAVVPAQERTPAASFPKAAGKAFEEAQPTQERRPAATPEIVTPPPPPAARVPAVKIFISYSRKDEDFARRLASDLDRLGAEVWIDVEDIPAGMNWSRAIQQGLTTCQVMILIISPDSMSSPNVEDEWQYYLDQNKPLIPVMCKPAQLHFQLNRKQYIDFHKQKYDQALERLRAEMQRLGFRL